MTGTLGINRGRGARVEIFKDQAEEWRWRVRAGNNKIVACSGEGYIRKESIYKALALMREDLPIEDIRPRVKRRKKRSAYEKKHTEKAEEVARMDAEEVAVKK